jgi:hypothetical protein
MMLAISSIDKFLSLDANSRVYFLKYGSEQDLILILDEKSNVFAGDKIIIIIFKSNLFV